MSERVLADVTRDGVTQFSSIPVELFFESVVEQQQPVYGGMKPYYRYLCIVEQLLDIRQNDYLENIKRIDPLTGQLVPWLDAGGAVNNLHVATRPERFSDGHIEFRGDDARTTGFT
jgi:hypothetical protein